MNYQGRLINGATPVDGATTIVFDIYDVATGGASLWSETLTPTVTDGLYAVELGHTTSLAGIFDGSSSRYLQLTIDGTPLLPRERILSVAYALNAATADQAALATNVSSDSITSAKIVDGTVSATDLDSDYVDVSGDTMTGALNIDSGAGNDLVIGSSGDNVMIGQSANGNDLGAAVGAYANGYDYGAAMGRGANGNALGVALGNATHGGTEGVAIGGFANGRTAGTAVGHLTFAANSGVAVGYWANGNNYGVGMGHEANGYNYGAALGESANGSHTNVAVGYLANAQGGTDRIAIGHSVVNEIDDSAALRGSLYLDGGDVIYGRSGFGSGSWRRLADGNSLTASDGTPIDAVYVDTDGKVGVGTTAPATAKLDVNSSTHALRLRAGNTEASSADNQVIMSYGGTTNYSHAIKTRHSSGSDADNAIDFYVWDYGTDSAGTVGTKHVMTIDGAGNGRVGIGTTSPSYALSVVGDVNVSGDVRKNGTAYANPDYVFEPDYERLSLDELKSFLVKHKHLPGMPSTAEVKEDGVQIFEQNRLVLEKLEEAYLYILDLEKRLSALEAAK